MAARTVSLLLVLIVGLLSVSFGVLPAYEELKIDSPGEHFSFFEGINRNQAAQLLISQADSLDIAETKIKQSIKARTLYAPSWLVLAAIKHKQKKPKEAKAYVDTAVKLWPNRPSLLWRASILYMQIGENASALSTLNTYLSVHPEKITMVASIAARLESNPNKLLDALIPSETPIKRNRNYFFNKLLIHATQNKNDELAKACWEQIRKTGIDNPSPIKIYLDYLSANNKSDQYITVFNQLATYSPEIIQNGGFESELTRDGVGWVIYPSEPVKTQRDNKFFKSGSHSYRFDFDGKHNVDYHHFFQKLPVLPGKHYRLSGFWKGKNISTRSTPYIEVFSVNDRDFLLAKSDSKRDNWDWEPFEFDFTTPDDTWLIRIKVRRLKTDALDRLLSGSLWLDDLSLKPIPHSS